MRIETQLSIFLENRPGALAKVCGTLAENGINVLALTVHDTVDHAIVRVVCAHPVKALLLLEQQGLYLLEQKIVIIELDNRPGELARIAQKLARADINIEYAYCTATDHQEVGCLVLKTDDSERTLGLLREAPA